MKKQILGAAGLLTAGLLAGSAFSITGANAADSTTTGTTSSTTSTTDSTSTTPADKPDIFSATSIREGEANVDAATEAKLTAAALAEVPGATVIRAETDSDGAKYEVHLKNADGSVVTVKFDENFVIIETVDGFAPADDDVDGDGRHGGHHEPGDIDDDADGPDGDDADDDSSFTVDDTTTSSATSDSTSTED